MHTHGNLLYYQVPKIRQFPNSSVFCSETEEVSELGAIICGCRTLLEITITSQSGILPIYCKRVQRVAYMIGLEKRLFPDQVSFANDKIDTRTNQVSLTERGLADEYCDYK